MQLPSKYNFNNFDIFATSWSMLNSCPSLLITFILLLDIITLQKKRTGYVQCIVHFSAEKERHRTIEIDANVYDNRRIDKKKCTCVTKRKNSTMFEKRMILGWSEYTFCLIENSQEKKSISFLDFIVWN
jgi:hypothetical protein